MDYVWLALVWYISGIFGGVINYLHHDDYTVRLIPATLVIGLLGPILFITGWWGSLDPDKVLIEKNTDD